MLRSPWNFPLAEFTDSAMIVVILTATTSSARSHCSSTMATTRGTGESNHDRPQVCSTTGIRPELESRSATGYTTAAVSPTTSTDKAAMILRVMNLELRVAGGP